jgi:hypothetical protein
MAGEGRLDHLVFAVRAATEGHHYYAGLALALALPDICGHLENPDLKGKARYLAWFDRYMAHHYTRAARPSRMVVDLSWARGMLTPEEQELVGPLEDHYSEAVPEKKFLTGGDFYALRCAYLHQGEDDITGQSAQDVLERFQFVVPQEGRVVHNNRGDGELQLQVDIFCEEICEGVEQWQREVLDVRPDVQERAGKLLRLKVWGG